MFVFVKLRVRVRVKAGFRVKVRVRVRVTTDLDAGDHLPSDQVVLRLARGGVMSQPQSLG